jgi:hypothetical protein
MRRKDGRSGARIRLARVIPILCAAVLGCEAADSPAAWEERWQQMGELGRGFLVWESNRTGRWRIWYRNLDGSGLRQLSPEEEGRDHFAPHISPDGTQLAYLSYPSSRNAYQPIPKGDSVPLHLLRIEDGSDRVLVPSARSYREDRAVVWIGNHELIYIDGRGITQRLGVASGEEQQLTEEPDPKFGFLIDPTLTHATRGRRVSFSLYDPEQRRIALRRVEDGCQSYFSHDGRWGFWIEKAGGPVRRVDLVTGVRGDVVGRNDPRMPKGHRYLYFPMLSSCQRLLAFGASRSRSEHDHFKADYDIFVGRVDPISLELVAEPVRYSFDPGTDRFPDVFLSGMELGHHRGEAPLSIVLKVPNGAAALGTGEPWRWDFGDGTSAVGETGANTFERPGLYQVTASRGSAQVSGDVKVDPALPPEPTRVVVHDAGREVAVTFDEPIAPAKPHLSFESGAPIREWHIAEDGRTLVLHRDSQVENDDHLVIEGFVDRAQVPNSMETQRLLVEPREWPSRDGGLVFLWKTARDPNLVRSPGSKIPHTYELAPHRKARLDHHYAMLASGGYFRVPEFAWRVVEAFGVTNSVTVEATLRPESLEPSPEEEPAGIVTFSRQAGDVNRVGFALAQRGDELVFSLGTSLTGAAGSEPLSLGRLSASEPSHVIVSYRPGRLVGFVNGEIVLDTDAVHGDLGSWSKDHELQFGMRHGGEADWEGTIEGVALYNRFMGAREAAANARAYLQLISERDPVERIEVRAKQVGRSHVPTLKEIVPYQEALVMFEYEVVEVLAGELGDQTIRVAHWGLLRGRRQSTVEREEGEEDRLVLEPFEDNPQVANSYLSDTLPLRLELPVYLDVDP